MVSIYQLTSCGGFIRSPYGPEDIKVTAACYQLGREGWRESETGRMPNARSGGVAASQNNRLVITGLSIMPGDKPIVKGKGSGSEVQYWSAPDWQPAAKVPSICGPSNPTTGSPGHCFAQYGHCIAYAKNNLNDNIIHIIGGGNFARCVTIGNWPSRIKTQWTIQDAEMSEAKWWHSCAVLNNTIYVLGGMEDSGKQLDSSEIFDPVTREFRCGPKLPKPFSNGEAFIYNSALHLFYVNEGEIYRLAANGKLWEKLGKFPHLMGKKKRDLTGDVKGAIVLKDTTLNC